MNTNDGKKLIEDYKNLRRSLLFRNILLILAVLSIPFTISAGIICNSWLSTIYGIYAGMIIAALIFTIKIGDK